VFIKQLLANILSCLLASLTKLKFQFILQVSDYLDCVGEDKDTN